MEKEERRMLQLTRMKKGLEVLPVWITMLTAVLRS